MYKHITGWHCNGDHSYICNQSLKTPSFRTKRTVVIGTDNDATSAAAAGHNVSPQRVQTKAEERRAKATMMRSRKTTKGGIQFVHSWRFCTFKRCPHKSLRKCCKLAIHGTYRINI